VSVSNRELYRAPPPLGGVHLDELVNLGHKHMGNKTATKRPALRRLATFTAALGMLTMSSGVALMVTAAPANAANKVGICHATSSDSNPYVFISVDDDSAKLKGHLKHLTEPNKTWKSDGTFKGVPHEDGDAKRDLIGSFTDDQGVFHLYDGDITEADCNGEVADLEATADVDFTDPTCLNENEASYEGVGENVTFEITDGAEAPGSFIEVTATADDGSSFEGGGSTQVFTHTFDPALNLEGAPCVIVNPPGEVTPVAPEFIEPDCDSDAEVVLPEPTVVEEEPEVVIPTKASAVVLTADVDGVHYEVSGDIAPGGTVEVTASAIEPSVLADGAETFWTYTFAELSDCDEVAPPAVTPTVVSSGVVPTAADLRGEQGLALLVAGMILMVVAGGLGVVRPGGAVRS